VLDGLLERVQAAACVSGEDTREDRVHEPRKPAGPRDQAVAKAHAGATGRDLFEPPRACEALQEPWAAGHLDRHGPRGVERDVLGLHRRTISVDAERANADGGLLRIIEERGRPEKDVPVEPAVVILRQAKEGSGASRNHDRVVERQSHGILFLARTQGANSSRSRLSYIPSVRKRSIRTALELICRGRRGPGGDALMKSRRATGARLELHGPDLREQVIELTGGDLQIGRAAGQEIHLDDARVSRHHARIEHRSDGSYYIVDLDSKGSTSLDGRKLFPFHPVALHDGSRITIVEYELILRDPGAAPLADSVGGPTILESQSLDELSVSQLTLSSSQSVQAAEAILDVNRALAGALELDEILGRALDGLMKIFPATERGFILIDDPPGRLRLRAVRQRNDQGQSPVPSRTLTAHVMQQGNAVLIRDTTSDPLFKGTESMMFTVRTALCVPLLAHNGQPLGLIQLDRLAGKRGFKLNDLELLVAVSVPIGIVVENHRLLKERLSWAAARKIQTALLPRGSPKVPGYTFWEYYKPSLEVGGDLYDYIRVESAGGLSAEGNRLAITIGDVAGHGMPSALFAASICPEIRHLVHTGVAPEEVLARINRQILGADVESRFLTMALALLDAQSHTLTVVSAGHMDPLLRRASGGIEAVRCTGFGPPLGVDPNAVYRSMTVPLQPGDLVVLYTDGVTDALNADAEPFGEDRLRTALSASPPGAAKAGEAIMAAVNEFARGPTQYDDITIVCFGRLAD
jgi:phosphoserine phosphatase RsbU/P